MKLSSQCDQEAGQEPMDLPADNTQIKALAHRTTQAEGEEQPILMEAETALPMPMPVVPGPQIPMVRLGMRLRTHMLILVEVPSTLTLVAQLLEVALRMAAETPSPRAREHLMAVQEATRSILGPKHHMEPAQDRATPGMRPPKRLTAVNPAQATNTRKIQVHSRLIMLLALLRPIRPMLLPRATVKVGEIELHHPPHQLLTLLHLRLMATMRIHRTVLRLHQQLASATKILKDALCVKLGCATSRWLPLLLQLILLLLHIIIKRLLLPQTVCRLPIRDGVLQLHRLQHQL